MDASACSWDEGSGFQLKPGEPIDPAKVEKTFVLEQGADGEHERQLLTEVPYAIIEAVTTAVDEAERMLGRSLGRRLTIAVIDHIQFVLERLDKGIRIPTTNMPELRVLHPQEFAAASGDGGVDQRRRWSANCRPRRPYSSRCICSTPRAMSPTARRRCCSAACSTWSPRSSRGLGVQLDSASPDYARFILHMQFLLQRLVSQSMLRSADSSFFEFAKHSYPRSFAIAQEVKAYVARGDGVRAHRRRAAVRDRARRAPRHPGRPLTTGPSPRATCTVIPQGVDALRSSGLLLRQQAKPELTSPNRR